VTTATPTPPAPTRKRGRESVFDMVRSLGLCLLVVVPIWYLAQPPPEAEQRVRVVEQAADVDAWRATSDPAPAPGRLPESWRPTVSQSPPRPAGLRLGWNTGVERYVEFAATTGSRDAFVAEFTGSERPDGSVDIGGTPWERYVDDDGSVSLVRTESSVTVVVGTRRSTATDDELQQLARSVRP
jgi:hypothetical protein